MWCMSHLCEYPRRSKEGVGSPGVEVTGSYKMPHGVMRVLWKKCKCA